MPENKLDILVLLRESSDPRPPASVTTRGAAISERGLRRLPNPADLAALEEALHLKDMLGARVTVLAIGPDRLDDTLRLACSMGADRSIRFWDHGLEGGDAVTDARVLARILAILSPNLFFTGSRLRRSTPRSGPGRYTGSETAGLRADTLPALRRNQGPRGETACSFGR